MLSLPIGSETVSLPTSWAEVTLRQAQRLAATPTADVYGLIGCLIGRTRLDVMSLPAAGVADVVLPALVWAATPPDFAALPRPAVVTVPQPDGERVAVPVPASLALETFGQAVDLGNALQLLVDDVAALRIRALAIYLYPAWSGLPYDSDQLEGFEALCGDVTLCEAVPITDFFLSSTSATAAPTPSASKPSPSPTPSAGPGLTPSPPSGRRWPWLMRWPRATKPAGTTSSPSPGAR